MRRSSSIFKEDQIFIEEENNSSDKVDMVEEEQDGIGNLVDLPKIMFINEECGNLKVVGYDGELARNNVRKKSSEVLQAYRH